MRVCLLLHYDVIKNSDPGQRRGDGRVVGGKKTNWVAGEVEMAERGEERKVRQGCL